MFGHVGDDTETRLLGLEVAVLDTGLDDIERSRDDERCRGTSNGCDEVLEPGGTVVVGELVEVFLGSSATTKKLCCVSVDRSLQESVGVYAQRKNRERYGRQSSPNLCKDRSLRLR